LRESIASHVPSFIDTPLGTLLASTRKDGYALRRTDEPECGRPRPQQASYVRRRLDNPQDFLLMSVAAGEDARTPARFPRGFCLNYG